MLTILLADDDKTSLEIKTEPWVEIMNGDCCGGIKEQRRRPIYKLVFVWTSDLTRSSHDASKA